MPSLKFTQIDGKEGEWYSVTMKCDTCGKEVKRIVVDAGYDRTLAKAIYNCPECYEKKLNSRKSETEKS